MAKLVSKTYGEALYELAVAKKETKQLLEEIRSVNVILDQNPDLDKLMKHPGIPKQEKSEILEKIFKGRISEDLMGFFQVVVEKERYTDIPAIFADFTDRVKEAEGIGVAYVTTAVALDDKQKDEVLQRLLATTSYRSMEMQYAVDETLIGGMTIRVGDRVVDSSIRSRLEALTKQLLQIQLGN